MTREFRTVVEEESEYSMGPRDFRVVSGIKGWSGRKANRKTNSEIGSLSKSRSDGKGL